MPKVSFLIKLHTSACSSSLQALEQLFSCEFCEIFKNNFFAAGLHATDSCINVHCNLQPINPFVPNAPFLNSYHATGILQRLTNIPYYTNIELNIYERKFVSFNVNLPRANKCSV